MVHSAVFHKHCVHLYCAFGWNCPVRNNEHGVSASFHAYGSLRQNLLLMLGPNWMAQ